GRGRPAADPQRFGGPAPRPQQLAAQSLSAGQTPGHMPCSKRWEHSRSGTVVPVITHTTWAMPEARNLARHLASANTRFSPRSRRWILATDRPVAFTRGIDVLGG